MSRLSGPLALVALALAALAQRQGWIGAGLLDAVFAAAMALTLAGLLRRFGLPRPGLCGLGLGAAGLGLAALPGVQIVPYLAIAPINLLVAAVFARGLLPGRTPVLLQLIALMNLAPVEPAGFRAFVRGQCRLWAVSSLALGLGGALAMVSPTLRPDLGPVLGALLLGQAAWFVLSHHYAAWAWARPETWGGTLRTMARPATWTRLQI